VTDQGSQESGRPARQGGYLGSQNHRDGAAAAQSLRIAILGAGGFIGSHLVEHLISAGQHRIIGVDIADDKLSGISAPSFVFHRADVRHAADLIDEVVRTADLVVDLVAYANPSIYVTSPLEVFELNFMQNLEIAKRCIKYGKRLIQYSSAEVYGKAAAGTAFSEDRTDAVFGPVQKQRWIYATAKMLLERVLYAHGVTGDLEYTIVRPFNFIGSRIDYLVPANAIGGPRVFPHFMSALLTGGPIRLVDGGYVQRAFLHIDDANLAFQALLDHPVETRNEIYNVGNPANDATVRQVALLMMELYEELTGSVPRSELVEISGEEFYGPGYEDATRLPPDISKLRSLGWTPRYDLRATLRDAMIYYLDPPRAGDLSRGDGSSLAKRLELRGLGLVSAGGTAASSEPDDSPTSTMLPESTGRVGSSGDHLRGPSPSMQVRANGRRPSDVANG
jgi:UDP-apiose/xylose synthase